MSINEPVHVPSKRPGHEGWLLAVVDRVDGDDFKSELWVIDGDKLNAGPVARVKIPVPLRPQVHGWWVSAAQLAKAK
jgi:carotenoid cleavage dioxygenase-like enzyme